MEFVLCRLGTCKMTPICKPTSTSKPALPTNHPFCRMGGALLQATSHNMCSSRLFFRMGGDVLSMTGLRNIEKIVLSRCHLLINMTIVIKFSHY
jgi:hypothetical protein